MAAGSAVPRSPGARRRRFAVIGGVASGLVVLVLVLLSIPLAQESSGVQLIDLHPFAYETVSIFGNNWANFSFHGVHFTFHLWCGAPTPGGAAVCGNATETDGTSYPYSFWDGLDNSWQSWVAPDGHESVIYHTGGVARLAVAI